MGHIVIINDYSLAESWRDAREGRSPLHFLYGVDHLEEQGHQLTILSEEWSRWLAFLDRKLRRFPIPLGSLDRQGAAIRFLERADAIYAPCQTQTQALTYLAAFGVVRTPIICLGHHPLLRGRPAGRKLRRPFLSLMLRGLAAMPTLSRAVADEANAVAARPLATPLRWGPDAPFYRATPEEPGHSVIAAGRTGRDFEIFGRAATVTGVPATILTLRSMVSPEFASFGSNIAVLASDRFVDYATTVRMFASARALAIPMVAQDGLCGLTSLLDALGAGKPVIMTRNAFIDIDIEQLGIGRWVDPGDLQGWKEALRFFDDNPAVAVEMGRRARALVDAGLNYRSFSEAVARIVHDCL
jgi:hypothetical protein